MSTGLYNHCFSYGVNTLWLTGVVTLGSSGAISSQSCNGFTVTQTASETGRYTLTISDKYREILTAVPTREISADTAEVQAKGSTPALRGVDASGKVAYIQYSLPQSSGAAGADAVPEDSAKLRIAILVSLGGC